MAMKRFPLTSANSYSSKYRPGEKLYATLELNQVAFPKTGMVVSQTPLGDEFTLDAPCENGMWVVADKAAGAIKSPAAATDKPIGIVYTTEKEYDIFHYGLQTFGRKIAGDYPRVGILGVGDTVTTNCLQYDDTTDFPAVTTTGSEKTSDEVLDAYLSGDLTTNKAYVIISSGQNDVKSIPRIVKTLPNGYTGIYGRIVKYYTVPNGEKGVKYQIISL
jgi:uncharacterized protein (UPF0218 family)